MYCLLLEMWQLSLNKLNKMMKTQFFERVSWNCISEQDFVLAIYRGPSWKERFPCYLHGRRYQLTNRSVQHSSQTIQTSSKYLCFDSHFSPLPKYHLKKSNMLLSAKEIGFLKGIKRCFDAIISSKACPALQVN